MNWQPIRFVTLATIAAMLGLSIASTNAQTVVLGVPGAAETFSESVTAILDGGHVDGNLEFAGQNSALSIVDGTVDGRVFMYGPESEFHMSGGQIESMTMSGGNTVRISGGNLERLDILYAKTVEISAGNIADDVDFSSPEVSFEFGGGNIGGDLIVSGPESAITMTGGQIGNSVDLSFQTEFEMHGGEIGGTTMVGVNCEFDWHGGTTDNFHLTSGDVNIYGTDLSFSNLPGPLLDLSGTTNVSGTLADGTVINTTFSGNGMIHLISVPEPTGGLLFGLVSLIVFIRKRIV